jgi:hypothetical protein
VFLFLLVPVWGTWMGYTYYADLLDVDGPAYRVAMLLSIALAVSVYGALDGGSSGFVAAYVALLIGLYAWAWRHAREIRPLCARYVLDSPPDVRDVTRRVEGALNELRLAMDCPKDSLALKRKP